MIGYAVGNAAGPQYWEKKYQPRNHIPWLILSICWAVSALLLLATRFYLAWENARRESEGPDTRYDDVYVTEKLPDGSLVDKKVDKERFLWCGRATVWTWTDARVWTGVPRFDGHAEPRLPIRLVGGRALPSPSSLCLAPPSARDALTTSTHDPSVLAHRARARPIQTLLHACLYRLVAIPHRDTERIAPARGISICTLLYHTPGF